MIWVRVYDIQVEPIYNYLEDNILQIFGSQNLRKTSRTPSVPNHL